MFSTITSPVFSELVIVLAGSSMTYLPEEVKLFETLRSMNELRPFKLAFLFEGRYFVQSDEEWVPMNARSELKKTLDSVAAKGFLDFLDSPPTLRTTT